MNNRPSVHDLKKKYGLALPSLEIDLILGHILGATREFVLAHPEYELSESQQRRFQRLSKRRQQNEPLAYIVGQKEFYGLDFKITPDTLIPRPETEMLVDEVLRMLATDQHEDSTILDIGTGSGNIIISAARNTQAFRGNKSFYGLDISKKALRVARHNARKHQLEKKIKLIESDLLSVFLNDKLTTKRLNHWIIVANLPYLSKKILTKSLPDVKNYEPRSALESGLDGLEHYQRLLTQIAWLHKKYQFFSLDCLMEFSPEQKTKLTTLIAKKLPLAKSFFQKDLSGRWRMAHLHVQP